MKIQDFQHEIKIILCDISSTESERVTEVDEVLIDNMRTGQKCDKRTRT